MTYLWRCWWKRCFVVSTIFQSWYITRVICVIFSVRGELIDILLKVIWLRDLIIWISGERCTLRGVKSFLNWTNESINSRPFFGMINRRSGEHYMSANMWHAHTTQKCWTGCQKGKSILFSVSKYEIKSKKKSPCMKMRMLKSWSLLVAKTGQNCIEASFLFTEKMWLVLFCQAMRKPSMPHCGKPQY